MHLLTSTHPTTKPSAFGDFVNTRLESRTVMVVIRTYRSKTMSCLTIAVEYRQELENGQIRTTRNLVFVHFILSSHSGVEFFVRREYREFHSGTLSSCLSSVLLLSRGSLSLRRYILWTLMMKIFKRVLSLSCWKVPTDGLSSGSAFGNYSPLKRSQNIEGVCVVVASRAPVSPASAAYHAPPCSSAATLYT